MRIVVALPLLFAGACSKEVPTQSKADAPATASVEPTPAAEEAKAEDGKPPPLSEEDKRLIAADPKTLTPDERRKRAFALRRKIMQNPDSETAKMLEDLRRAAEAGELQAPAPGGTAQFETRTAREPAGGPPPAGSRPEGGAEKAP
jgi:hypothetical protein